MNKLVLLIIGLLFIVAGYASYGQDGTFVYSRDTIEINSTGENTAAAHTLEVEIRSADDFYRQDGWFNLAAMQSGEGLLLLFETASTEIIPGLNNFSAIDLLMIDTQGTITRIVPSLVLADMAEPIAPTIPAKAFLLLNGGAAEALNIQPGDSVVYKWFKKPHPVMDIQPPAPELIPQLQPEAVDEKDTGASGENIETKPSRLPTPEQPIAPPARPRKEKQDSSEIPRFDLQELFSAPAPAPQRRRPAAQPQ